MAHLGKKLAHPKTVVFLTSIGYENTPTCSDFSLWRHVHDGTSSEFFVDQYTIIDTWIKLLDYIWEQGFQTGQRCGHTESAERISKKIKEFINE